MNPRTERLPKLLLIFAALCGAFVCTNLQAGSATWSENPVSDDWYTAANWNPQTVPNGPNDVATFGLSSIRHLNLPASSKTLLDSLIIQDDGTTDCYTITVGNESTLTFVGRGALYERELCCCKPLSVAAGGTIIFRNNAVAQTGISDSGIITFEDNSSCLVLFGSADVNSGGVLIFSDQASAGAVINVSGSAYFNDDSTGRQLTINPIADGVADISGHHLPGLTVKTLDGNGTIFLGANNLTVSTGFPLSRSFFGVLMDGGASGGTGGSLTKVSSNSLTLFGSSSYTSGTTVTGGELLISTDRGSTPVGTGDVHVNAGRFGGKGAVQGNVIVGTGTGALASLVPSKHGRQFGPLSIRRTLTFASDGILDVHIYSTIARSGKLSAKGVTITSGAQVELGDRRNKKIATGKVLTLIENTASTPIAGSFANLPDGSTITVGANTYQADYEGGDGNDLTLTVIN